MKKQDPTAVQNLCTALGESPIVAKLLINRGQDTPEKARRFLCDSIDTLHDPMLLRDMDKAVARIEQAERAGEKITIYGDYDVDGVTSTAILYRYLKERGFAVDYYIPDRVEEGYGINCGALDTIAASGTGLLITVDSGITAIEEIAYASKMGLDVIVTDHHECKETLPVCCAVVNPKRPDCGYPFQELAGVGVAFKLIAALAGRDRLQYVIDNFCELAAFGTIADVMPLHGENRVLVALGLKRIEHTRNIGLAALMEKAGVRGRKITAGTVGFTLAPRINAAGRIGCATRSVELFLTRDPKQAAQIASELCDVNRQRQEEENVILEQAEEMIAADPDFAKKKIIVLAHDGWHHGVIGIVASRLSDKYYLPSVLISFDGDAGKGSGRSVRGFNLYEALAAVGDSLVKFGGHALAAGLTVDRESFPAFRQRLEAYAQEKLDEELLTPVLDIDCALAGEDIRRETIKKIYRLEPYGMGNPAPVFLLEDAEIVDYISLGGGKHMKMTLRKDGAVFPCICFGRPLAEFPYFIGDRIDVAGGLEINVFRGEETPQISLKDIRMNCEFARRIEEEADICRRFHAREGITPAEAERVLPLRRDFEAVFQYLRREEKEDTAQRLFRASGLAAGSSFGRFLICLAVFEDMELLRIDRTEKGMRLAVQKASEKKDLDRSEILIALRAIKTKSGKRV